MLAGGRIGAVALALLCASPALAQQTWWVLKRSNPVDPNSILDSCVDNYSKAPSPAALYEMAKTLGMSPEIADKGDEVDVTYLDQGSAMQNRYFRTQEGCQTAAQGNIDTNNAEKAKVDKYR